MGEKLWEIRKYLQNISGRFCCDFYIVPHVTSIKCYHSQFLGIEFFSGVVVSVVYC